MVSILVVGAGELGTAILRALAHHPRRPADGRVTVLLRPETLNSTDAAKKRSVDALRDLPNVHLQGGDFISASADELAAIFKPFDIVVQAAGYGFPDGTQTKIMQAALTAGVPWFLPWQFGIDYDQIPEGSFGGMFDEPRANRAALRRHDADTSPDKSPLQWTIVSTGLFTSYLFLPGFGVVDVREGAENQGGPVVRALGSWDNGTTTTAPTDIGTCVAELLWIPPPGPRPRQVHLSGDTVTYAKLADMVERHLEKQGRGPPRRELWDVESLERGLAEQPDDLWCRYRVAFARAYGVSWDKEASFNVAREIPLSGVQEYIAEHL